MVSGRKLSQLGKNVCGEQEKVGVLEQRWGTGNCTSGGRGLAWGLYCRELPTLPASG